MIKRTLVLIAFGCMFSLTSVYSQTIKPPDTKSLMKKIIGFFNFKQNFDAKKKKELDSLLAKINTAFALPLADSIKKTNALTMINVEVLIDSLNSQQKKNYQDLISTIELIMAKTNKIDSLLMPDNSLTIPTNDDQLTTLAKLMTPILEKKVNEKDTEKQKDILLAKINGVITHGLVNDTIKVNDTLTRIIKYSIAKKARLIGFNDDSTTDIATNYLNLLDGVAYYPFGFDGKTGSLKNIVKRANSNINIAARQAGKEIIETIFDENEKNLNNLLQNAQYQTVLINTIVANNNSSVCLWFKYVAENNFYGFALFVDALSTAIKKNNTNRKIYVRIPPYIKSKWLKLKVFEDKVDYFMVDFTHPVNTLNMAPVAPLKGNKDENIESCMSLYTKDIAANKFIVCFAYKGFAWRLKDTYNKKQGLTGTVTYKEIMGHYAGNELYDDEMSAVYVDSLNPKKNKIRIWFDDEYTLGLKYDYVVNNNLGGVAIWSMGDDEGYGKLYDEMAYKFILPGIDTLNVIVPAKKIVPLTIFQKMEVYAHLYKYMFDHPCDVDFANDTASNTTYKKLLTPAQQDSIAYKRETLIRQIHIGIFFISAFFLLVTLVLIYFYIKNTIYSSRYWKWKKPVIRLMVGFSMVLIMCIIAALFTIGTVPYFGFIQPGENATTELCINISFTTLVAIVSFGIIAGCILTKFLLFPLFKRDDIP